MIMPGGEHQGESSVTFRGRLHPPPNNINTLYADNLMLADNFGLNFPDDIQPDLTRRRRSSITVAVLLRRNEAVSYVLNEDRYSAVLGFRIARPRNQINIYGSQNIQIGPTIVRPEPPNSTELMPFETNKPKKRKNIRCSVAVFVCWAIVVSCGIISKVAYNMSKGNNATEINPPAYRALNIPEWWYICRKGWKAESPLKRNYLEIPIQNVIIGHSEFNYCDDEDACKEIVLAMQKSDTTFKFWDDIGPNFIVTGNGMVFEGRGANVEGDMLSKNNDKSITIMFLGDYERNETCSEQFDHLKDLLTVLVEEGFLVKNYNVLGECQISDDPLVSPGPNVMAGLEYMEHWNSEKTEGCIRREIFLNQRVNYIIGNMGDTSKDPF